LVPAAGPPEAHNPPRCSKTGKPPSPSVTYYIGGYLATHVAFISL